MAMFYLKSGKASRDGISSRDGPDNGGGGGSNGGAIVSSSEDAARGGDSGGDEAEESKLKKNSFTEELNTIQHLLFHSPGPS